MISSIKRINIVKHFTVPVIKNFEIKPQRTRLDLQRTVTRQNFSTLLWKCAPQNNSNKTSPTTTTTKKQQPVDNNITHSATSPPSTNKSPPPIMDRYLIKNKRSRDEKDEEGGEPQTKKVKVTTANTEEEKVEDDTPNNKEEEEEEVVDGDTTTTGSSSSSSSKGKLAANKSVEYSNLEDSLDKSWRDHLSAEFSKKYFKDLKKFLVSEGASIGEDNIFPPKNEIFNAFNHCKFNDVKVVILGQDPYQTPNYAHGLAFSVKPGVTVPKSLINIYKELESDIKGFKKPKHGNLMSWADQGVLLLNTVLTVKTGVANSHQKKGWEQFTDAVIDLLNKKKDGLVFILWGKPAQTKGKKIDKKRHHVLESAHPSPLSASRGFFGCKHFSKCNKYLRDEGKTEIDWQV